jgi:hypothetical protein
MRDYLYIWHDAEQQCVVMSGMEFRDVLPCLVDQGGVLLLKHQAEEAEYDTLTAFNFVPAQGLARLAKENIYSWGDFVWADYSSRGLSSTTDDEVAELVFFSHKGRPLHSAAINGLGNKFLASAHDDGWYLRLHYAQWRHTAELVESAVPATLGAIDIETLRRGEGAFWLRAGQVHREERTYAIDSVLNRRL